MFASHKEYRNAWAKAETHDPPVPLHIDVEISSTCNLACPFCRFGEGAFNAYLDTKDWDGKPYRRFASLEQIKGIVDEAHELGIPAAKPNYRNEPTMHPDFVEIMGYMRDRFLDLLINTNANCGKEKVAGILKAHKVMVSLDSMDPDIYPSVRVKGDYGKALSIIDELAGSGHPNVWVRRVICAENKREDFVGAVKKRWADKVRCSEHFAFDRNKDSNQAVHNSDYRAWERRYCAYPSARVVITASGRYMPCCLAWQDEFDMGKWPILSIKRYWEGQQRKKLVSELKQNIFKNKLCQNCTSYQAYERPERKWVTDIEGKASV